MAQAPLQPSYVFRGHAAQIHSTAFIRSNSRLVTGDAAGWVIVWSLETKRPVAVWNAHQGAILGVGDWDVGKIITHGKDNKLIVWKLGEEDEQNMSTVLPVDTPPDPRRHPWILHVLEVNTMNFCPFASCAASTSSWDELLIAAPNTLSSETVDIFHLPSASRIHTVPNPQGLKGGMVMSLSIFTHPQSGNLTVIAGFESGHVSVAHLPPDSQIWQVLYISQPHTQPLLSLAPLPDYSRFLTSSADAILSRHPIPFSADFVIGNVLTVETAPEKMIKTGHSGQQDLKIRNDGKAFVTAGWDGRARVYGVKALKELAVLAWHQGGVYAVAFARVDEKLEKLGEEDAGKEVLSVKEIRIKRAREAHWLVVGGKDGKVSLWDIY